jgi:hypothetical protein
MEPGEIEAALQGGIEAALQGVQAFVRTKVAAGFRPLADIAEEAVEIGALDAPADEVRPFVPAIVEECARRHLEEQADWPEETDCDRLSAAFEQLERQGIIARQDFSCCSNCGVGEIWDEIQASLGAGRQARGYTFFHMQDTDRAVDGDGLYLNYGAVEKGADSTVAIGYEVVQTLERHGLSCQWNGSITKRIMVPIKWQRRR